MKTCSPLVILSKQAQVTPLGRTLVAQERVCLEQFQSGITTVKMFDMNNPGLREKYDLSIPVTQIYCLILFECLLLKDSI